MSHSYGKCKTCGDSLRKVHEHWMTKPLMLCFKCEGIRKPVAQKVSMPTAKGWKCHCCGFDGTENQPYNRFCVQCRRSR